jgi:Kef-type K+ transport system membrane component KefB
MERFITDLSVLLAAAALLSFLAVLLKQPIIIAYIFCGMAIGPSGLGWVREADFIDGVSRIGTTLLLFLAGLCLHPQKLLRSFRATAPVTLGSCSVFFLAAFLLARLFGFNMTDAATIGLALMFSSTILVVKLLPTTTLHHQRMGAVAISILIMQDLLAILVLAFLRCRCSSQSQWAAFGLLIVKLCFFLGILFLIEQFVLRRIMLRVERWHESLFVLGLAWCFGIASVSHRMGLFFETGAFFAGVVLARHPISLFISERFKPIRDFFLVLFFFSLGAKLELAVLREIWMPAVVLTAIFVLIKPWVFKKLFILCGERDAFAGEAGIRLGQVSEFSLLIAVMAFQMGLITHNASQLVEFVAILTFVISSYIVISRCPTPLGTLERLRRD